MLAAEKGVEAYKHLTTAGDARIEVFSRKLFVAFGYSKGTATTRQCGWSPEDWYSADCSTNSTHSVTMAAGCMSGMRQDELVHASTMVLGSQRGRQFVFVDRGS